VKRLKAKAPSHRRDSEPFTLLIGSEVVTLRKGDDGYEVSDPVSDDVAAFVIANMYKSYGVLTKNKKSPAPTPSVPVKPIAPTTEVVTEAVSVEDMPSDEDLPGVTVGEVVDGDEAESKTVVKIPSKKQKQKPKPKPKPKLKPKKPKKTKRR